MTSLFSRAICTVLAAFVPVLTGCNRQSGTAEPDPLYIMLTQNGGACQQNGSDGVIDAWQGRPVIYQGAATLSEFQVQFTDCPFASCPVNSPNGISVNIGKPRPDTAGRIFTYSGLRIDHQECRDLGQMGLRVRSGP